MKRILQIGLGWGLALGIAGAMMVIVYQAAPILLEQHLQLEGARQEVEQELAYEKKKAELEIQMEEQREQREQMRLRVAQNGEISGGCKPVIIKRTGNKYENE